MSPHAVPSGQRHSADLKKFAVTKNAFLPADSPLKQLPDPYYEPWELIAQHMPQLIESDRVRGAIDSLPVLSTEKLRSEPEWRRAHMMLAFFTHAYVWGGDEPAEILPPSISVPFLRTSAHLELPPVLSYAAANLWNFSCSGDDFSQLEDLSALVTFTGTESESWFLLISVAMEAKAAGIIPRMLEALEAVRARDYEVVAAALDDLRRCIEGVGAVLERMYERCDPMTFYHRIRPFLAGSMNMAAAGLPRGVFYDEGPERKGEWRHLRGGSNGQSSLIQFFDVVLGVEHASHGAPGQKSFHDEVREYMPGPHRRFLTHVARMGSIRELALAAENERGEPARRLREAYAAATEALAVFRNKHIQIVTRYIILPSKQPWTGGKRKNLASASSSASSAAKTSTGAGRVEDRQQEKQPQPQLTGTGGTMLIPFLKQSRDETSEAGKLQR